MPAPSSWRSSARIGVMPLPAASSNNRSPEALGKVISPNAWPSSKTSPIAAAWARCWLTAPPAMALTVIAKRPSASTVGL